MIGLAILVGFCAGALAGMLGIGGGALFVPALVLFLDLAHVEAEATSLLAIVPVAVVGAWQQQRYGNLRLREGLVVGALAVPGAIVGVVLVNVLPERAVEVGFGLLLLFVSLQLVRSALRPAATPPRAADRASR
ncbi:sulfite exporter TauE/SafE family protein [Paraconexibacter sp.]|uniref:sulfite exporter TauE/SafE family protein n=1 Tax=Paraconexibacter sp. TaxID=2949640 RepID=UPI003565E3AA